MGGGERYGGEGQIKQYHSPYVSLPACWRHAHRPTLWTAGQGLESLTLGQPFTSPFTLRDICHGSTLGMLFGISGCHFSFLPWTLEFVLDSGGCFLEVGMLTLALQSR